MLNDKTDDKILNLTNNVYHFTSTTLSVYQTFLYGFWYDGHMLHLSKVETHKYSLYVI